MKAGSYCTLIVEGFWRVKRCWIIYKILTLIILRHSRVDAVCNLETGQNAIYWWIPEDRVPGSVIDVLPIEGNTSGKSPEMELSLVSGSHWFKLDSANKLLILKQAVDRDFGDVRLDGVVECRSLLPADHDFRVNISISVKIQDVNDNAPVFDSPVYEINVTEELPPNTVVFTGIRAVDADQPGPNSQVTYGIVDDGLPTSTLLSIPNPWEGTLIINRRIDYEQLTNFSFTIIAKDNGFPSLSSTALVHVLVQDVDDQNPQFDYERYTASVAHDTSLGAKLETFPAKIKAHDLDTLNAPLTYTLSGVDSESFEIDSASAEVRLKKPLTKPKTYLIPVHAHQTDRPERQAAAVLVVRVSNSSRKRKLQFSTPTFSVRVSESTPVNSQILRLTLAEDAEGGVVLMYSIRNTTDNHFRIDHEKGTLWLIEPLDYETAKDHRLQVGVTDGTRTSQADVIVIVENANDNSPIFRRALYHFSVNGTADEIHGSIGTVEATDADENDHIVYSLLNLNDIFAINDLGQLRIRDASKLANRSYELVIAATDSGNPPRIGHTTAKVEILDKARWHVPNGFAVVGKALATIGSSTIVVMSILAAVLLVLTVTVLLLGFYVCRLRKRKRRTLSTNVNKRRQADGIILANPVEVSLQNGSCLPRNSMAIFGEPMTPTTDASDAAIFPVISSQSLAMGGSIHEVPLTVDTGNALEYSVPFIQPRHSNVMLRHPILDSNRGSTVSLSRTETMSTARPSSWSAAKPTPSLTVYF